MRVLAAQGRFQWVRYGTTGRQLLGLSQPSDCWHVWDLASGSPGVQLARNDPRLPYFRSLMHLTQAEAFLRAQGYWPVSEEWPTGRDWRPEHVATIDWTEWGYSPPTFTPDGRGALRHSSFELFGTPDQVAVWDFAGQILRRHAIPDPDHRPRNGLFSADGRLLAFAYPRRLEVRDATTDAVLMQSEPGPEIVAHALSPDARWLAASAGRTVRVWDVQTGQLLHRFPAFRASCQTLSFSPDGRLLAAGSREGRVRIWEAASGRESHDLTLDKGEVAHVTFSPDGLTLAAACEAGCVVIIDVD